MQSISVNGQNSAMKQVGYMFDMFFSINFYRRIAWWYLFCVFDAASLSILYDNIDECFRG